MLHDKTKEPPKYREGDVVAFEDDQFLIIRIEKRKTTYVDSDNYKYYVYIYRVISDGKGSYSKGNIGTFWQTSTIEKHSKKVRTLKDWEITLEMMG